MARAQPKREEEAGPGKKGGRRDASAKGTVARDEGEVQRAPVLVALLPNGQLITVKVKSGEEDVSPRSRIIPEELAAEQEPWACHTCGHNNLPLKKRCSSCQAWRGGKRKNPPSVPKSKAQAPSAEEQAPTKIRSPPKDRTSSEERGSSTTTKKGYKNNEAKEIREKYDDKGKADLNQGEEKKKVATIKKREKRERNAKDDKSDQKHIDQEDVEEYKEEAEMSMGARLPKRKRTHLYSSLSPAVIQATAKARAAAFAAAPPSPQLASKSNKRKQSFDKKQGHPTKKGNSNSRVNKESSSINTNSTAHPAAVAVETAASDAGGKVPSQFIGHDGNLFYCRICLGLGEVVCCDGCPHVFHPHCLPVGPSKASLENDDDPWYCHECVAAGRTAPRATAPASVTLTSPSKKRRKAKGWCSLCNMKETKAHPCVPCSARGCNQYFHLVCPENEEVGVQNNRNIPSSERLLCTSCKAAEERDRKKQGGCFQYDQNKLEVIYRAQGKLASSSGGRGGGKGSRNGRGLRGQGGSNFRRMSSSDERMKRLYTPARIRAEQQQGNHNSLRGRKRVCSSGFQLPYEETEDDDGVGPQSLAYVEKPLSSTPAFFLFLLHHRSAIEKSLHRSPFFRGMGRGTARNEKVAREGAATWIEMTPMERDEWVKESMKDFEKRVVAWKEKEVIEAMIKTMDDDIQEEKGKGGDDADHVSKLPPEDKLHISESIARMNQHNKVKCSPKLVTRVNDEETANPILLELLNDMRFCPLPLVSTSRAKEDLLLSNSKIPPVAVQQYSVQGPIEGSLGDSCMGCTRGWSHYCPVLKRPVPGSEHRAKLQPPISSLTATRIGLGFKVKNSGERDNHSVDQGANVAKLLQGMSVPKDRGQLTAEVPNYQPRNGFFLLGPSLRLDDATSFIESAVAISTQMEDTDGSGINNTHSIIEAKNSPLRKTKMLSRGLLPLRGHKKKKSLESSGACLDVRFKSDAPNNAPGSNAERESKLLHQCGNCGTMQSSPFGCIPCRKSHLVTQMAKRNFCSPNSVAGEFLKRSSSVGCINRGDGFNKPQCVMLGRSYLNETSVSGRTKHTDGGVDKIGSALTLPWWSPNAILPPRPKRFPKLKSVNHVVEQGRSDDFSTSKSSSSKNDHILDNGSPCQTLKGGKGDNTGRHRSCTSRARAMELSEDTNTSSHKHKEDAKRELSRKTLAIACSGILVGMIRRDPMRLFAKPVSIDNLDYHQLIHDPIDLSVIREKVLSSSYNSLGSFIADARRLCVNACVFNAADTLYANTATVMYDYIREMHDRAKKWISIQKRAHVAAFADDDKSGRKVDPFKEVELMWPGAMDLLKDSVWLEKQVQSDFVRTRENEIAYYGLLAIQRASAAAKASLASATDLDGINQPVVRRSHIQDENLRKCIDREASLHVGPIQLKEDLNWRDYQLLKLLKLVQKLRIERRMLSKSGCARCEGFKSGNGTNEVASLLRNKFKTTEDGTKTRIAGSRLSQSTGLASRNARERKELTTTRSTMADSPPGMIGQAATNSMVSVRGSKIHGWGLFADRDFKEGEVIAEYVGEYVSDAVADLREKSYQKQRIQDYQFRINESLVIDATLCGGNARYINHSCSPNCVPKVVDGESPNKHLKRVLVVSQRDIKASEELSYDYQFPLEMNLDLRIECNCGSKQCRGFMNWDTPEKSEGRTCKRINIRHRK